ncbi:DUF2332 domain-containing protein [Sphingomonas sp. 28-62-11]|uniref:DUF2332 domain-containing protein n=1 Tax=Sphingomonas sp. 28-62-11 TaxID=1970432 RepID=UPI000BD77057|nr:MAG: hypothetical protein B7Y49_06715 [Sphingomonas sp. 28-62-11]
MADEATNRDAFKVQAEYSAAMDAPIVTRVCLSLGRVIDRTTATGRAVLDWPGDPVADAVVLRLVGGVHALHRSGADWGVSRVFRGELIDPTGVDLLIEEALQTHDAALLPWLDGPPQTNEAGRSAGLMTGLLHLAQRFGPKIELLEIGSSAGLNLLIDRYGFDLGGVRAGPDPAELSITPEWRGPPPPDVPIEIDSVRGVDIAPVDLVDDAAAERLAAYVWVDAIERQARIDTAIAMVRRYGVQLESGDAADWVEARLAEPQAAGVTRVLMHSVVWQYIPKSGRDRIRTAMASAGARATAGKRLGWVMMEPNRDLHRHEVRVQGWPGETPMELVALTHAHGAWVEGLEPPYETRDYVMRGGGSVEA